MSENAEQVPVETGEGQGQSATQVTLKKSKAKSKEMVKMQAPANQDDFLMVTAYDIENLSKEKAFELADDLLQTSGFNDFRLGGVLKVIQEHKEWQQGFGSFDEMVENRYGIKYRKAMYLIEIYKNLVTNQIPWEKVKHLGWTKLQVISRKLTPENVDEWVEKAEQMTALALNDAVRGKGGEAAKSAEGNEGQPAQSQVTTMTFKAHPDQKDTINQAIEKAKEEVKTEVATVALEAICIGYLGGSVSIKTVEAAPQTLAEVMKQNSLEDVLAAFDQVFPDVDVHVAA